MEVSNVKRKPTYIPLIVGIILTVLFFLPYKFVIISRSSDKFILLGIHLILRIGIVIWTFRLVNYYKLKGKYLWAILGFLFAGFQLIAINIAILLKLKSSD